MRAAYGLRHERLLRVYAPTDVVDILVAAWSDGKFPISRMQQKLYIVHSGKLPHTEHIKCDFIFGNGNARAFRSCGEELPADNLVAIEIKGAEVALADFLHAAGRDTVRGFKVSVGVIVYPVVVDWDITSKDAIVNDLHRWQSAGIVMPSVGKKNLGCLKLID